MLLKDRLYVGYLEKTGILEVISYNEAAGRFEFQLVKDHRAGAQPKVFYANRAICISCHQNHAPIFSRAIWGETNANGLVAALLRAQRADFSSSAQANIDFPDDIDKSTVHANTLVTLQKVWRQGCSDAHDRAQSRRCRAVGQPQPRRPTHRSRPRRASRSSCSMISLSYARPSTACSPRKDHWLCR
ncbi:MAG TPA: hypothetical protein VFB20_04550 [Burkholderiales bacterium]|nr:hypothetical protein [Burkholderiales bacterium]